MDCQLSLQLANPASGRDKLGLLERRQAGQEAGVN